MLFSLCSFQPMTPMNFKQIKFQSDSYIILYDELYLFAGNNHVFRLENTNLLALTQTCQEAQNLLKSLYACIKTKCSFSNDRIRSIAEQTHYLLSPDFSPNFQPLNISMSYQIYFLFTQMLIQEKKHLLLESYHNGYKCLGSYLIPNMSITNATFEQADFSFAFMENMAYQNVTFKNSIFSYAFMFSNKIEATSFKQSEFTSAKIKNVCFKNSHISHTSFRHALFSNVQFFDSIIQEIDMTNTTLSRVSFHRCQINHIDLNHAVLRKVKFTATTLNHIRLHKTDTGYQNMSFATIRAKVLGALHRNEVSTPQSLLEIIANHLCKTDLNWAFIVLQQAFPDLNFNGFLDRELRDLFQAYLL